MAKKSIEKIVGKINVDKIDKDIVEKYDLTKYQNQNIIQDMNLYSHVYKHAKEFKSIDSFNNAIFNIDKIIKSPYYVYYDKERNSLLYYKKIDEDVCAVVKLNLRKNKNTYVATIYPVNTEKVNKKKAKEQYNKYIINN